MVGHDGDEYMCSHDHHVCGDEYLSFQRSPTTWACAKTRCASAACRLYPRKLEG